MAYNPTSNTSFDVYCRTCKNDQRAWEGVVSDDETAAHFNAPETVVAFINRHSGHNTWVDTLR
jgi:hypothetical protein